MDYLPLSQLNSLVKEAIECTLTDQYWVQAELASINDSRGHCYMELVEKAENGALLAQARACCWKGTWMKVLPKFMNATNETPKAGMKVLIRVYANFHEAYGFSWVVTDIDPTFTIGDMARRRQEIIRILTEEGVIDLNKQLCISPFCKRIAVISSATAAGYGDFCNQLTDNEYGFLFYTQLFPAIMQGERVEETVISALDKINSLNEDYQEKNGENLYDCVIIIRGGGSTTDLSGFDTLALAENVANFPLPVITGIGHDRDQSILDIVACVSVKTPTAVAEFLISNLAQTLNFLEKAEQRLTMAVQKRMEREKMRLVRIEQVINSGIELIRMRETNKLNNYWLRITGCAERKILTERNRLMLLEQRVNNIDPARIMEKGYSITMLNGKAITSRKEVKSGDNITIMLTDGSVSATII